MAGHLTAALASTHWVPTAPFPGPNNQKCPQMFPGSGWPLVRIGPDKGFSQGLQERAGSLMVLSAASLNSGHITKIVPCRISPKKGFPGHPKMYPPSPIIELMPSGLGL